VHPSTPSAPQGRAWVNFWDIFGRFGVAVIDLVSLDRLLRATSKKRSSTFLRKKSAPRTKSWLRLCFLVQPLLQNECNFPFCSRVTIKNHYNRASCSGRLCKSPTVGQSSHGQRGEWIISMHTLAGRTNANTTLGSTVTTIDRPRPRHLHRRRRLRLLIDKASSAAVSTHLYLLIPPPASRLHANFLPYWQTYRRRMHSSVHNNFTQQMLPLTENNVLSKELSRNHSLSFTLHRTPYDLLVIGIISSSLSLIICPITTVPITIAYIMGQIT